jgi:hypothetical protein
LLVRDSGGMRIRSLGGGGPQSKRWRQRRMLGLIVAIVGELSIIGSNRRLGWRNWFKSVARTGAYNGIHPGGGIAVESESSVAINVWGDVVISNMRQKCDGIVHRGELIGEDDHRRCGCAVVSNPRQKRGGIGPRGGRVRRRICARQGSRVPFGSKVGLVSVKSTDGHRLGTTSTQNTRRCRIASPCIYTYIYTYIYMCIYMYVYIYNIHHPR